MRARPFPIVCCLFLVQAAIAGKSMAEPSQFDLESRLPGEAPALAASGPSGGLTVPDGRVLPDGDVALGIDNYLDPRYSGAKGVQNYLFGIGIFPYVELSGRATDYTAKSESDYLLRDLSANAKVTLPKLFSAQPDIAFGANDIAGGAKNLRSTYVAASQRIGFLYGTIGLAHGESYLNGFFAGVELPLGNSGFSTLAERNDHVNNIGLRYASKPYSGLGNARFVVTAQHSFDALAADGSKFDRTTLGFNIVIPFGANARNVRMPEPSPDAIWTPPSQYRNSAQLPQSSAPAPVAIALGAKPGYGAPNTLTSNPDTHETQLLALQKLQAALEKAGLERVRVGIAGAKLVIEYENHRYNQNEVDALGIALGSGARIAPQSFARISVVTKKAGLPIYETSVEREGYLRFLDDGDKYEAREGLEFKLRPVADPAVQWLDPADGKSGYSRIQVEPLINSFVATEFGMFDYSLAMNVKALIPLWRGAEFSSDYVQTLSESAQVKDGVFAYAHQSSGLKSAMLNQSFWVTDDILNIVSVGKLMRDFTGVQNETTVFVPNRDDQIRFQYTRAQLSEQYLKETEVNMAAYYRWAYRPLDTWIEAGYSKYVQNDRGPSLSVSRWFGDIEAQAFIRRSNLATYAGFQLSFPLTPRQGMRPGLTQVEGAPHFGYGLQTRLAGQGNCNCIISGIAQEIPIGYSASEFILNEGRYGANYLVSQLPRMREALLLFGTLE